MSREIKFRAWDKKQNKMLYGVSIGTIKIWDEKAPIFSHEFSYSEDCIFEQYTGLKDKNGKEIYEGDRIKIEDSDTIYTVEYGRGVWTARFGNESGDNICLFHYVQKDMVLYAEVIGNIHENPELLKGGEDE